MARIKDESAAAGPIEATDIVFPPINVLQKR